MTTDSSHRRSGFRGRVARLFRFRLLTLLIFVTLICGWLAWRFHREPISPENVSQLRALNEIPTPNIFKLAYSPDRSRVAFVRWEQPVEVKEAVTLWPVRTIGPDRKFIHFAFSTDRQRVAATENGRGAEILSLDTGRRIVLDVGDSQPRVVFSPDAKLVVTGGYAAEAKVWDAGTGQLVRTLACGTTVGGLTPVFSPDGRTIAVGNRNSNTILFAAATGERLLVLPKRNTQELAFHPSGEVLAVAYVDGSIRLWETASGQLIAQQLNVAEEIYTLDWSPDGKLLASGGLRGSICIWDEQLQLLQSFPAPEWVISVKFGPDGTRLMTAGGAAAERDQRSITVWGIPPAPLQFFGLGK